jgi:hypothetical protein
MAAGLGLGMFEQSKGAVGQYHSNLQVAGIDRNAVDVGCGDIVRAQP